MTDSAFDHRPNPDVGRALREVLTASDDAAFVRRVVAAAGAAPTLWGVLGGWVRPGLAAAVLLMALAGYLRVRPSAGAETEPLATLDDPVPVLATNGAGVAALFASARPPDVDLVLAASVGR